MYQSVRRHIFDNINIVLFKLFLVINLIKIYPLVLRKKIPWNGGMHDFPGSLYVVVWDFVLSCETLYTQRDYRMANRTDRRINNTGISIMNECYIVPHACVASPVG